LTATAVPAADPSVNPYWRRNLYVCLFGSFTNMAGMTLMLPFLPNYIRDLGMKDNDGIVFWSAVAFSAAFLAAATVSPIWGWLADLYGRKPMLIRASLGMAIAMSMMGMAHNVYELVALRAATGFLGGYTSGCVILVASQTPKDRSAWALGKLSIGSLSGSLLGPLIGGVLPGIFGLRDTFLMTGAVIFVTFLLTTFVIREDRSLRPKRKDGKLPPVWSVVPDKRPILVMLVSATLLLVANMSIEPICRRDRAAGGERGVPRRPRYVGCGLCRHDRGAPDRALRRSPRPLARDRRFVRCRRRPARPAGVRDGPLAARDPALSHGPGARGADARNHSADPPQCAGFRDRPHSRLLAIGAISRADRGTARGRLRRGSLRHVCRLPRHRGGHVGRRRPQRGDARAGGKGRCIRGIG
jgi:hypothetical protein